MNNEMKDKTGMTLIVKTVTDWIKTFIFLFGCYIVIFGHLTPGGGFAGGVIIACAFVLIVLAFGKEKALGTLSKTWASHLDSIGALLFLLTALLGTYAGGVFFINFIHRNTPGENFKILSAGIIPICNIAIGIKVFASLFMVFIILSVVRVVIENDEFKMIRK